MRILLTNDDGIESPSLKALSEKLSGEHEIWVIAPETEMSGCSHSVTLRESIRVKQRGERIYSCGGTPADCVILSMLGLIKGTVDMVLSGPNFGPNLGTDIVYSGTAAAARQAVLMGYPAIATSLVGYSSPTYNSEQDLAFALEFIAKNLSVFKGLASPDHFLNINFPKVLSHQVRVSITFPSIRIYQDTLEKKLAADGTINCRIGGPPPESHLDTGSDYDAVDSGEISISPILIHPMNHRIENKYRQAEIWPGNHKP